MSRSVSDSKAKANPFLKEDNLKVEALMAGREPSETFGQEKAKRW